MVPRGRADEADALVAEHDIGAVRRQVLCDAVEVEEHEPSRGFAERMDARHSLLPPVAALVHVYG